MSASTRAVLSAVARSGLSFPQLHVLVVLQPGPLRLKDIREATATTLPSSTTRLCQRLEADGLITRTPGLDRREQVMALTDAGLLAVGKFLAGVGKLR